jgi:hypothetical protein
MLRESEKTNTKNRRLSLAYFKLVMQLYFDLPISIKDVKNAYSFTS